MNKPRAQLTLAPPCLNDIPVRPALLVLTTLLLTTTLSADVGTGAPSEALTQRFVNAYFRNGFSNIVSLPPIADVARFGATGLHQEFRDAEKTTGVKLALVKSNLSTALADAVYQVQADVYGYYLTVGVNTAGYPTMDTAVCPAFEGNSCTYQFFDKSYVLFAYKTPTLDGQNFTIRNPFYTKWTARGGLAGLGRPTDTERALTIQTINATVQAFSGGAIYNITSGTFTGQTFAVAAPISGLYLLQNAHDGFLGLPTSDEITLASGRKRQSFQGGNIEYDPGTEPVLRLPVASVGLTPISSGTLRLKQGDTYEIRALVSTANGAPLTDRVVNWTTSNSLVATVQGNGVQATIRAVGGGSALIAASSEGKVSPQITVIVSAPCCQVGEGAPSPTIQQSFQDAITRNRISIQLPAPNPVRRVGAGYVQEVFSTATPVVRYLIAKSDRVVAAFLLSGDLLARYEQLGGPAGALGHPVSDATAGGRQLFENAAAGNSSALAGNPVRLVSGAILTRWAALGYETGAAGAPVLDAETVMSSSAAAATRQVFAKGLIMAARFVSGPILDRYNAIGGQTSALGLPATEEFSSGAKRRQNFEGGYIDYLPGDAAAVEHAADRRPTVSAFPAAVIAGSRVRLAVSGFADGATLRISLTGQPDFVVTARNGAHAWESYVPLSASSTTIVVQARDIGSQSIAETSYTVRSLAESRLQLVKIAGDNQAGAPGALLPQRLRVALRDESGNPVIGAGVTFAASPGAQLASPREAITDENGEAEAVLRLPPAEGVALATSESSRLVTTFSARVSPMQLAGFPKLMQSTEKGALSRSSSLHSALSPESRRAEHSDWRHRPEQPPSSPQRLLRLRCRRPPAL